MLSISDDQLATIRSAAARGTDGVTRALNPADPEDAAAIRTFLNLTGKTEQTHPGLYGDLASLADAGGTVGDQAGQVLTIVDSGRDAQGRATARVWHQDTEGGHLAGSLALALDADSGQPVALGYANRVGGGVAPAATRSDTAAPAPATMTTVGFYHAQSSPEATPQFGMVSATAPVVGMSDIDATVTAPVSSTGTAAVVDIGLGRPFQAPDLDYYYTQDTGPNSQPVQLVVPFTGSVNVHQPLANVGSDGQFTSGLTVSTQLYSTHGQSYIQHDSSQSLNSQITGDTTTNVVSWNYAYDPDGTPGSYTSLMYATDPTVDNTLPDPQNLTAFYFSFSIPVENNPVSPYFQFNVCSIDWPEQPSENCYQIQPLAFWWHCLAEGTEVTLADGSVRPIEQVDNTMRVRTGDGGSLGVEATTRSLHKGSVVRLSTDAGQLLVTPAHPIGTPDGLRRAGDLAVGDVVRGAAGPVTVTGVESVESDVLFANLKLVDATDRAAGLAGSVGTFIANGIVVGDHISMTALHQQCVHSLDYMLPRLPERYHVDYASTLRQIAADNVRYGGTF
jgi:hypothetical protein